MMKPSLHLRVGQQLTMTPQLQQAIRLLQLPAIELQAEIQQAFEENPMLEQVEERPDEEPAGEPVADSGADSPVETTWDDLYTPGPRNDTASDDDYDPLDNRGDAEQDLREHLLWQLQFTGLGPRDLAIATAVIDAVDDDGYLLAAVEEIRRELAEALPDIQDEEVEAVLHLVQQLDPVGCAARDLSETLRIQLAQLPPDTLGLGLALHIAAEHLDLLARRGVDGLVRALRAERSEVQQAVRLIRRMDPKPGARIGPWRAEYAVPDVIVRKIDGIWRVELNPEVAPRLRINPYYAGLVRRADRSEENRYLRSQLQEARWFLRSLQSRGETLLRVATAIVSRQRPFLEYGEQAMRPLVLREIAEELDLHESTVSRVTTRKYMHTPRGVFEFKYFFSSHVGTADGGTCSATAIRALIRKLIAEEPPGRPLSDSRIAAILSERGIEVARRTVAKYRESMQIPSSTQRRKSA